MFTGIIEELGKLEKREGNTLIFSCQFTNELKIGDSIAHNGVCLTVTSKDVSTYAVDLMPETFKRSNFDDIQIGDYVNLERSMKIGDRLDGHIVQGHIDFVSKVVNIEKQAKSKTSPPDREDLGRGEDTGDSSNNNNCYYFTFSIPKDYRDYFVEKGSVSINGISMTITSCKNTEFTLGVIPHTYEVTNFKYMKKHDKVNIETDVLAKYFVKQMLKFKI